MALARSTGQLARRGLRLSSMRLSTKPVQTTEEQQEMRLLDKFQEIASALDAPLTTSTQTGQTHVCWMLWRIFVITFADI
jgi:hypothetical protein